MADNEEYKDILAFDSSNVPENLLNTYWNRKDLYDLELIKNLSIDFYFRTQGIKTIAQHTRYDLKEFESKTFFSDVDVRKLLKNGISSYMLGSPEKYNLIDDFVTSILCFFDPSSNNGYEISKSKLMQLFSENQIIIKGFNDALNDSDHHISDFATNGMMLNINDENYLRIIEEELIYIPNIEIEVFNRNDRHASHKVIDLSLNEELNILIKSDYFDIFDSACLISLDEPSKLNSDINYADDWNYGEHKQAIKVLNYAIKAQELDEDDELIPRASLQNFLFKRGTIIKGFNEHLGVISEYKEIDSENSVIERLKQENKKLKAELLEKNQVENIGLTSFEESQEQETNDELLKKIDLLEKALYNEKNASFLFESHIRLSQSEITQLKESISILEVDKKQLEIKQNAMTDTEVPIENNDLMFISILLKMLQNEIKVKSNKSQAKILQKIEDSHSHIKGLSKSRTEKIMGRANKLYNSLINN